MNDTTKTDQPNEQKENDGSLSIPIDFSEELLGPKPGKKPQPKRSTNTKKFPFPKQPLEEAIKVSAIIKNFNGGNPYPPEEIASALKMGIRNNVFYRLLASSRDYGLTNGTTNNELISLSDLGRKVAYAKTPEEEHEAYWEAFFYVNLFKSVHEHYQGQQLPQELKYIKNTLETTFKLPPELHQEFFDIYTQNIKFLGIQSSQSEVKKDGSKSKPTSEVKPTAKTSLSAFVAMPFSEKSGDYPPEFFKEVLKNLIEPAANVAGFKVGTAQRQGSDVIHSTIVNSLLEADLVIVDLTEHNPNVLFELGLRIATEKPIILIRAKGTPQIFDVDSSLRVLDYDPRLWKSTIDSDVTRLTDHIKGGWDSRDSSPTYMSILKRHTDT